MLFYVFLLFLALSIIFMWLGFAMNIPLISFIGALVFMGMGLTMLNVDVQIRTSDVTNLTYSGDTVTSLTTTPTYEDYDFGNLGQSSYGWIMTILGTALFLIFLFKLGD